jgi:hypothetical protein
MLQKNADTVHHYHIPQGKVSLWQKKVQIFSLIHLSNVEIASSLNHLYQGEIVEKEYLMMSEKLYHDIS